MPGWGLKLRSWGAGSGWQVCGFQEPTNNCKSGEISCTNTAYGFRCQRRNPARSRPALLHGWQSPCIPLAAVPLWGRCVPVCHTPHLPLNGRAGDVLLPVGYLRLSFPPMETIPVLRSSFKFGKSEDHLADGSGLDYSVGLNLESSPQLCSDLASSRTQPE